MNKNSLLKVAILGIGIVGLAIVQGRHPGDSNDGNYIFAPSKVWAASAGSSCFKRAETTKRYVLRILKRGETGTRSASQGWVSIFTARCGSGVAGTETFTHSDPKVTKISFVHDDGTTSALYGGGTGHTLFCSDGRIWYAGWNKWRKLPSVDDRLEQCN